MTRWIVTLASVVVVVFSATF
ncbi:MAG: hypothetical protein QOG42_395, partial [Solirubrobacteraceae bacterium]|nr:hypothetical protein [Solirubrobacteraceae bacterium]